MYGKNGNWTWVWNIDVGYNEIKPEYYAIKSLTHQKVMSSFWSLKIGNSGKQKEGL